MIQLPNKSIRDKQVQENFQAIENGKFLTLPEYPAGEQPGSPAAGAIIFTQDNGAGKTKLMVQFPTGVAQQVSIEP